MKILLDAGFDPEAGDGETVLDVALSYPNPEAMQYFQERCKQLVLTIFNTMSSGFTELT